MCCAIEGALGNANEDSLVLPALPGCVMPRKLPIVKTAQQVKHIIYPRNVKTEKAETRLNLYFLAASKLEFKAALIAPP